MNKKKTLIIAGLAGAAAVFVSGCAGKFHPESNIQEDVYGPPIPDDDSWYEEELTESSETESVTDVETESEEEWEAVENIPVCVYGPPPGEE